jgi:hypothetical protein
MYLQCWLLFLARPCIETTFAIYGCPVTTPTLLKRTSFPLDCLMLSLLFQAKLYRVKSLTVARKSRPGQVDTFHQMCSGLVGMLGLKPDMQVEDVEKIIFLSPHCTLDQEVSGMEED